MELFAISQNLVVVLVCIWVVKWCSPAYYKIAQNLEVGIGSIYRLFLDQLNQGKRVVLSREKVVAENKRFEAVDYEALKICKSARKCGKVNEMPLYRFLKEPLI